MKLVVGFKSDSLERLLEPSGPNVVSMPKTPQLEHFLKFYAFMEINLRFSIKRTPVFENWW